MYTKEELASVSSMNKATLREACKAAAIKGYGKMTVAQMRSAVQRHIEREMKKAAPVVHEARVFADAENDGAGAKLLPVVTTPEPAPVVLSAVTMADRETRNNVRRPAPGGKCDEVWRALDAMHAANVEINAGSVADLAVAKNWSLGNAQTELYQWRKWMGLSKPRAPKEKKPKGAAKAAPPATLVDTSQPAA